MYRPKNWKNPYIRRGDARLFSEADMMGVYEAGANAMLQAVRSNFSVKLGVDDDGQIYCNLDIPWAITQKSLEIESVKPSIPD